MGKREGGKEMEKAAPTGCYKCGRPGHWSRDCPTSSSSSSHPNKTTTTTTTTPASAPKEKPKQVGRSRPKLTPDLLLSDDGFGFLLRHFPRSFKYRGRGHEVKDLGNLIGLYSEWHSHLLPYYSFDHFVHKVEQVAASRRVKICLRDLRERVASGGDPTKFHHVPTDEQAPEEAMASEGHDHPRDQSLNINAADDVHEDLLHEIYEKATEEPSQALQSGMVAADGSSKISPNEAPSNEGSSSNEIQITDEQRARMEANRLRALQRAAARALPLHES